MSPSPPAKASAEQLLQLLPPLTRWATKRAAQAGANLDLSLRQYAALHGIQDGIGSAGELARRWQVTPAVITGVLDRLERRGLVRREVDPGDRRRLRLAVTEAGRAVSRAVSDALIGELAAQLDAGTAAELDALTRALGLLERTFAAFDAGNAALRAGSAPRQAPSPRPPAKPKAAPAPKGRTRVRASPATSRATRRSRAQIDG